jgi:signal transduction histidine kinase
MAMAQDILPADEEHRLEAVRRYDILDTPPDGAFDRVTALAVRFCDVPISTITIVDHDRIWFKSTCGIDADEIPRDPGLCASAILRDGPYVVSDAAVDPRTLDNPLVRGALELRFYAAVPLVTSDGYKLGTLNIIDSEPRETTDEELDTLADLAGIVVDELELRLAARRAVELEAERENARFRERIIAGLSHEMRTSIAVLKGTAEMWDDDDTASPDELPLHDLMGRHVRHLDWLIGQFLDYARLEADEMPRVSLEPFDVGELVDEAAAMVRDRARVERAGTTEPLTAVADRDRSFQILLELLHNAVRYAGTKQPIEVAVTSGADGAVRITVADRGSGIDPQDVDRVFEKFFRGADSDGTGIGLYLARTFAEAQGGALEVESVRGEGSRFTLVLPGG